MADARGPRRTATRAEKERLDRNLLELLNELRVALPGVQVLFAFLLTVPFTQRFTTLTATQEKVYYATLLCTTASTVLLIAPSAHHRINFRQQDKAYIVFLANKLTIVGARVARDRDVGGGLPDHRRAVRLHGHGDRDGRSLLVAFAVLWYAIPIWRRLQPARTRLGDAGVPGAEHQGEDAQRRDQHGPVDRLHDRARQHPGEQPVSSAIEATDMGANTASAAAASSWVGQRGDQQEHHGAGAGEPVQQPDAEGLTRRAHVPVAVAACAAPQVPATLVPVVRLVRAACDGPWAVTR